MATALRPPPLEANELVLRRMGLSDLEFTIGLHRLAFPTNVMGRLGTPMLKAYYRTFLDGPEVWAQVAIVDGRPAGYLVGVLDLDAYRRNRRVHHGPALAMAGLQGVFRSPVLVVLLALRRMRRGLDRITGRHANSATVDARRLTVLSHVAVAGDLRDRGIGTALVRAFIRASTDAAADAATLATLAGDAGAGAFYDARGWQLVNQRSTADHRAIRIYELPLSCDGTRGPW